MPMVYGTQGAVPLGAAKAARAVSLRKYSPDEPRVPAGNPQGGEWTSGGGDGEFDVAASGGIPCDGFSAGCQSGGSYGSGAMFRIRGRNLCWDCAVKFLGLENEPGAVQWEMLEPFLIGPR
jgi:hypothetical protein